MPGGNAWRRRHGAAALLALALAPGGGAAAQEFRVVVDEPAPGAEVPLPVVEVRGHAGVARARGTDVVIVLDLSESVLQETGVDLDGDGPGGRTDPALLRALAQRAPAREGVLRRLRDEVDFDDTVLAAELEAASALIERLDLRRFRVGLVAFSDEARLVAPVGSSRTRLTQALGALRQGGFAEALRGTHFADALEVARQALVPDVSQPPVGRDLAVVFLSDGEPTLPVHDGRARERAVEAAALAGLQGIRLHAFALGTEGARALDVLQEMAALTGGAVEAVVHPAEAASRLRALDLVRIEALAVRNATTGEPARALRTFPDGSFDAFVELAPGPNRLVVEARSEAGARDAVERRVRRLPLPAGADGAGDLLAELRRRTEEMRLWAEIEEGRRQQRREVEVEAVRPEPPPHDGVPGSP